MDEGNQEHVCCMLASWCAGVHVVHLHCGQVSGGQPLHQHGPWADHHWHPHTSGLPRRLAVCLHARPGTLQQEGCRGQHAHPAAPAQVSLPVRVMFGFSNAWCGWMCNHGCSAITMQCIKSRKWGAQDCHLSHVEVSIGFANLHITYPVAVAVSWIPLHALLA